MYIYLDGITQDIEQRAFLFILYITNSSLCVFEQQMVVVQNEQQPLLFILVVA